MNASPQVFTIRTPLEDTFTTNYFEVFESSTTSQGTCYVPKDEQGYLRCTVLRCRMCCAAACAALPHVLRCRICRAAACMHSVLPCTVSFWYARTIAKHDVIPNVLASPHASLRNHRPRTGRTRRVRSRALLVAVPPCHSSDLRKQGPKGVTHRQTRVLPEEQFCL